MRKATVHTAWVRQALRDRRADLDVSQAALADRIGVESANFVSMLERGRAPLPLGRTAAVAEFIGVPPWRVIRAVLLEQCGEELGRHMPAA